MSTMSICSSFGLRRARSRSRNASLAPRTKAPTLFHIPFPRRKAMFSLKRQSFRKSKKLETLATALTIGAALIAACSSAYSKEGGGPGNGGDAVFLNGKWQLLDLAEAGITKSEFFDDALSYMEKHRSKPHSSLSRAFVYATFVDSRFTPAFKEALAATLHQSIDAPTLMAVMRMYQSQTT